MLLTFQRCSVSLVNPLQQQRRTDQRYQQQLSSQDSHILKPLSLVPGKEREKPYRFSAYQKITKQTIDKRDQSSDSQSNSNQPTMATMNVTTRNLVRIPPDKVCVPFRVSELLVLFWYLPRFHMVFLHLQFSSSNSSDFYLFSLVVSLLHKISFVSYVVRTCLLFSIFMTCLVVGRCEWLLWYRRIIARENVIQDHLSYLRDGFLCSLSQSPFWRRRRKGTLKKAREILNHSYWWQDITIK